MAVQCDLDKTPYDRRDYYLGNECVRRAGSRRTHWTPELMAEYKRCRDDIDYFASNYIKVLNLDRGMVNMEPYPYQSDMWKLYKENRFSIVLAARQVGKCRKSDTNINIRNKTTGEIICMTMEDFHLLAKKSHQTSQLKSELET